MTSQQQSSQQQSPAFLKRFVILSPAITALVLIGVLITLALIFLGTTVYTQIETNRINLGINSSLVNRPFSQFERELLSMLAMVNLEPSKRDPEAFELKRQVLSGRWDVIFWPSSQASLTPEILEMIESMKPLWADIQTQLNALRADPDNTTIQSSLQETISDLDSIVFQADLNYQRVHSFVLSESNDTGERLSILLIVVSLSTMVFGLLTVVSIRRFLKARQQAEEKARAALAAEAAAVANSQFKDQFLSVMSHELRTPLNAMIGFLGIMQMSGKLEERNKHMVDRTRANAERLLTLINDILDLSKLESGRMELVPTPVSPADLAQQWQYQMDVLARQKGLDFVVEIDPALPNQLMADEGALGKIGINLLSNAFKFTEKGQVTLRLINMGAEWAIEVEDSGIGIPTHMHETIFESFRQVDNSFKRTYGGTGLGLSILQHIVRAMGGVVRLKSAVGEGTTFTIVLPIQRIESPVTERQIA